ncbi:hypothetical protein AVEN_77960-1, partial [Araneus ventricosus]
MECLRHHLHSCPKQPIQIVFSSWEMGHVGYEKKFVPGPLPRDQCDL